MFVECFNNNGTKYLRLVEGVRIKTKDGKSSIRKKVIYNIGPLAKYSDGTDDYIERLKISFKNGVPLIPELLQFCGEKPLTEYHIKLIENDPDCIGHPKLFSHILIEKILEDLGIIQLYSKYKSMSNVQFDLLGFFRLLVYGRILNPCSKIATTRQNNNYYEPIIDNPYVYNIYDTLDWTYKNRLSIIKKLNNSLIEKHQRTTNIVYYDVTNFFFEIERPDEDITINDVIIKGDRKNGVSKEERHLPIIQMGLFMDEQGIPISIETFPGNTLDHLTMIKALKNTVNNLELSRFIFVGDRGMCSYKNICHLLDHNNGYVISKSIEKSTNEEKEWILNQEDYIVDSDDFKYKSRIVKKTVKDENNQKRDIVEKVVVYWSKRFAEREKAQQKSFLDFLNKLISSPSSFRITQLQYKSIKPFLVHEIENTVTGEFIESKNLKLLIDKSKVEEYIGHMGYYQIVSSETNKSEKEIIDIYHGLSRIEDQFRVMKGTLDTRPIFVHTHEHIYAHLLICMISLIVVRIIQNKICEYNKQHKITSKKYWDMGLSGNRIQQALSEWTVEYLANDLYRFNNLDNKDLKLILDSFNINIPVKLFSKGELRHIKQTIDLSK